MTKQEVYIKSFDEIIAIYTEGDYCNLRIKIERLLEPSVRDEIRQDRKSKRLNSSH